MSGWAWALVIYLSTGAFFYMFYGDKDELRRWMNPGQRIIYAAIAILAGPVIWVVGTLLLWLGRKEK